MTYDQKILALEARFAGVSDPESMGTTGLTGWVLTSGFGLRLYRAYRTAMRIVQQRGGNADGFAQCLTKDSPCEYHSSHIQRWERARRESSVAMVSK